jgi:large subunit ribosomal protein L25
MEATELIVEVRKKTGKEAAAKTRQGGGIPAVLYGGDGAATVALTVNDAVLQKLLRGAGNRLSLLALAVQDETGNVKETAIIKTIQRHPVSEQITHIDFMRVNMKKPLTLEVPIVITGSSPGVKAGGVLQQTIRHVKVRCLPSAIPEKIEVDISTLEIGNVLAARDLKLPEGVEMITNPGQAILSITVTRYEEEAVAVAPGAEAAVVAAPGTEAPAQPEVIGEKEREERRAKKDEEKGAKEKEKQEIKETRAKEQKAKKQDT